MRWSRSAPRPVHFSTSSTRYRSRMMHKFLADMLAVVLGQAGSCWQLSAVSKPQSSTALVPISLQSDVGYTENTTSLSNQQSKQCNNTTAIHSALITLSRAPAEGQPGRPLSTDASHPSTPTACLPAHEQPATQPTPATPATTAVASRAGLSLDPLMCPAQPMACLILMRRLRAVSHMPHSSQSLAVSSTCSAQGTTHNTHW